MKTNGGEKIKNLKALTKLIELDSADRHYYVDFDYTLLLNNSTDLYINSAHPRFLFWPIMKAVGLIRPWVLMGREGTLIWRDPIRVQIIQRLLGARIDEQFQKNSERLWHKFKNKELYELLEKVPQSSVTVVSFGIEKVISALLQGTKFQNTQIIAPTIATLSDERRKGKLSMLRGRGIVINKSRDVVITDSAKDDADLLAYVEHGFHIQWDSDDK